MFRSLNVSPLKLKISVHKHMNTGSERANDWALTGQRWGAPLRWVHMVWEENGKARSFLACILGPQTEWRKLKRLDYFFFARSRSQNLFSFSFFAGCVVIDSLDCCFFSLHLYIHIFLFSFLFSGANMQFAGFVLQSIQHSHSCNIFIRFVLILHLHRFFFHFSFFHFLQIQFPFNFCHFFVLSFLFILCSAAQFLFQHHHNIASRFVPRCIFTRSLANKQKSSRAEKNNINAWQYHLRFDEGLPGSIISQHVHTFTILAVVKRTGNPRCTT